MNAPDDLRDLPPDERSLSVPPHSVETEQSVLGALLIDNDAYDRVIGTLRAEHFYRYDHRVIFECISKLLTMNRPADVITVFEWLRAAGKADQVGGLAYLNGLQASVASSANIGRYAQIVTERWKLRALIATVDEVSSMAFATQGRTASEIVEYAQAAIERIADDRENEPTLLGVALTRVVEKIDRQYHSGDAGANDRVPTGFTDLDHKLNGGFGSGNLIVVAGRPSMGKTALAMCFGDHAAEKVGPVAVFSLEMPSDELAQRAVARVGEMPLTRVMDGSKMLDGDWPLLTRAIQRMAGTPVFIDETPAVTLGHIKARTKAIKRKHGVSLVIIDYLQLMSASEGENRTQQVGANTRGLKALAKELNCPVVLLSQLSRKVEERTDRRPMMSDLRESGDIEQDADVILFVYRDEVYHPDTMDRGIAEIIIGKQRNGALGRVGLTYIGEQTRFADLAHGTSFGLTPAPKRGKKGFDE